MKIIGLLGGTGWVSTLEYYRIINDQVNKALGGLNSAECILYSVNYSKIDELNKKGKDEEVFQIIYRACSSLYTSGAQYLVLCANTLHQHAERLEATIPIPLIHIADVTAQEIKKKGITKVGLLGTRFTMEKDFYRNRLKAAGIDTIIPEKSDRDFIQHSLEEELLKSIFRPGTKKHFVSITGLLRSEGAQGIVLGCTEIPLLISQSDISVPVFNTLKIHAMAVAEKAMEE